MTQRNNETSITVDIEAILFRITDDIRFTQNIEAFPKLPIIIRWLHWTTNFYWRYASVVIIAISFQFRGAELSYRWSWFEAR